MANYFKIMQTSMTENRIPLSSKIKEYFEEFITDNILLPKKIMIGSKWNYSLSIIYIGDGKFGPKNIFMPKGTRTVSSENIKMQEILIPVKLIGDAVVPKQKAIELMYEAITTFLTRTYKKVTIEIMDELWKKVDMDYLLSLPYPAALEDQSISVVEPLK